MTSIPGRGEIVESENPLDVLSRAATMVEKSEISPRLRRIFMELRDLGIQVLWCPAEEMAHSDGFSRNPVDSADSLGADPINDKFHRHESVDNIIDDDEDIDDDDKDTVTTIDEADDPLYSSLY